MKYTLGQVTEIKRAKESLTLSVVLSGDDGSIHTFKIDLDGRDHYSLTLKEIEIMAINHAKNSFASCEQ